MTDKKDVWLFLDFDGVICDSLEECFQSSWLADHAPGIDSTLPPPAPSDVAYRAAFRACRPFVRSGEDYIVLHRLIASGKAPASQAEFDADLASVGPEGLARIKKDLYSVRESLLELHRDLWLGWNPLYPGMAEALNGLAGNPSVLILSTKKAEFIAQILAHQGVDWPAERIIYSGKERKLDIVGRLTGGEPSILVDDQVEHLDFAHPSCSCYAALWGYVTREAITESTARLELGQALELMRGFPPA
jgi:phosphoglycolate phosphatase-like HAD superfamily hydrolase